MRLVKSPASPTINQLGFRDVGKSGVAFSRRVSGCSNRAGLLNAASNLKSADFLPAERGSLQSFHARSLYPPPHCAPNIFPQSRDGALIAWHPDMGNHLIGDGACL